MNTISRTLLLLAGGYLVYTGYTEKVDNPRPDDNADVVVDVVMPNDETFPELPTNQRLVDAVSPIIPILTSYPDDALKFARTFKGWADLISRDDSLSTISQLQSAIEKSLTILLQRHQISDGRYRGKINPIINASLKAVMPVDEENNQLKPGAFTIQRRDQAVQALNALSAYCFQAFTEGVINQ